ncbi:hypothetical protein D3C78_849090 [compost metagenome]
MPCIEMFMPSNRCCGSISQECSAVITPSLTSTSPKAQALDRLEFAVSKSIAIKSIVKLLIYHIYIHIKVVK